MSTTSGRARSQAGVRRPAPSHVSEPESPSLGQRSVSLTTLQPVIQPRMAQLETLEAKMASIEVSLSSTPRRKKNGSIGGGSLGPSIRSIPRDVVSRELEGLRNALRDKENIIQSLKGQLNGPTALRLSHHLRSGSVCNSVGHQNGLSNGGGIGGSMKELNDVEKKQAEERLNKLKSDTDNKRLAIKNLKMALERLDITDNIDVRIQQAELEYQLGREELNLLTILEETRTLQSCLDDAKKNSSETHTLYSCVQGCDPVTLHAIEVTYDPKSPRFGAGTRDNVPGLWVDWALEDTGICKGDRLLEVNGKIVLMKTREDLARLLSAAPDPAQIVILRRNTNLKSPASNIPSQGTHTRELLALRSELNVVRERAEETQRAKDGLRTDNLRLTHRISYLEEQVAELLARRNSPVSDTPSDIRILTQSPIVTSTFKTNQNVTNINISSPPPPPVPSNDLQVFQKGPQVTALVANIPGLENARDAHSSLPTVRSKSSLSNVSNTHIPAPSPQPMETFPCHKQHRHRHRSTRNSLQTSRSSNSLDQSEKVYKTHHHHHHEKDYHSEASTNVDNSRRRSRHSSTQNGHVHQHQSSKGIHSDKEQYTNRILRPEDHHHEGHYRKYITASDKYNIHHSVLQQNGSRKSASVLDFRAENNHLSSRYSESKSVEALDSEVTESEVDRPKKTDSRSVKSLDFDSEPVKETIHYKQKKKPVDYTSEPLDNGPKKLHHYNGVYSGEMRPRPTPPKKPIRLSLHRAQSLQSVETPPTSPSGSPPDDIDNRKALKRNHKGEAPQIPMLTLKIDRSPNSEKFLSNGHNGHGHHNGHHNHSSKEKGTSLKTPTKSEGHSGLRWPTSIAGLAQHIKYKSRTEHITTTSDGQKWC